MVRIKELKFSKRKDISREQMKEMRLLKDLKHSNVNSFIGATIEPLRILIITDYCAKGSLYVRLLFIYILYIYRRFYTIVIYIGHSRKRRHQTRQNVYHIFSSRSH